MRDVSIEAFEFPSARCSQQGDNVGLFESSALACTRPTGQEEWQCLTSGEGVAFFASAIHRVVNFTFNDFAIGGTLPQPAV